MTSHSSGSDGRNDGPCGVVTHGDSGLNAIDAMTLGRDVTTPTARVRGLGPSHRERGFEMGVGWGEVWGLLGLAAVGVYVLWGPAIRTSRKKGLVPGLRNIGNACYLNALLQALATCAPLHAWLQGTESETDSEYTEDGVDERAHDECGAHAGIALMPGAGRDLGGVTRHSDADKRSVDAGFSGIKADARDVRTDACSNNAEARGGSTKAHGINADVRNVTADTTGVRTETHFVNTVTHGVKTETHSINTDTQRINTGMPGINTNAHSVNTDGRSDNTHNTDTHVINTEAHNTDTINASTHSINTDSSGMNADGYAKNTLNTDPNSTITDTQSNNAHSTNGDTCLIITRDLDAHSVDSHSTNGNHANPDSMDSDVDSSNVDDINTESVNVQNTHSSSVKTDKNDEDNTDLDARTVNIASNGQDSDTHRLNTDKRNNNDTDTHCVDTQNTRTDNSDIDTEAHSKNIVTRDINTAVHSTDTAAQSSNGDTQHTNTNAHSSNTIICDINTERHVTDAATRHTGIKDKDDTHSSNTGTDRTNTDTYPTETDTHGSNTIARDVNTETHSTDPDTQHGNTDIKDKDARRTNTRAHCSNADRRHTDKNTHGNSVPARAANGAGTCAVNTAASSAFEGIAFDVGEDPGPGSGRFIVRRSSEPSTREHRPPGGHLHSALLGMLRVLMGETNEVDAVPVHAGPVLEALRSHGWEIPAHQEQDAHELFAVVMTTLEEERQGRLSLASSGLQLQRRPFRESAGVVNRVTGGINVPMAKSRLSPFLGRFAITLQCTRCKHKGPVRLESFESISLTIPKNMHAPSVPLELCLESFFRSELLTGVKCDACSQTHPAGVPIQADFLKRTLLAKLPPCVCIHLHRLAFSRDAHAYKENGHVSFRSSLDLARYTLRSELSRGRVEPCGSWYTLTAVVVHYGNSTSGHFVTYRSIPSGGRVRARWVCCSDDEVRSVSLSEVLNSRAYLLFYTRM